MTGVSRPDRRSRTTLQGWLVLAIIASLVFSLVPVTARVARATSFAVDVTTELDSNNGCATTGTGTCSLRDAIRFANAQLAADITTITLHTKTYLLTQTTSGEDQAVSGDLDITKGVIILGDGASNTIIDGNAA